MVVLHSVRVDISLFQLLQKPPYISEETSYNSLI